ncbi:AimR family lysis-lysogeny pheromone receptor [Bacillus infantis]|uniref:AimR family lysis-lysogeny pheromone receptor n=1 Tax=Bacillus infantis TaxID=324767 RepID=UPI003CF77657
MEEQKGLRQMLINRLESERGLATKMAKLAGYSSSGALMKVLRKVDGDIEKFDGFVRVVHELFPEEKFDLMSEFAKTLNPNRITSRLLLEYASSYSLSELRDSLIESLCQSDNDESSEWGFVYKTDRLIANNEIGMLEGINLLAQRKYISQEMKVYSKICQFYAYYDMRNIVMMEILYKELLEDIEFIKNPFIKSNYTGRLFLIEADVRLHNGEMGGLREKLFLVDNALDPIKSFVYLQVGNSYMFSNYEKAKSLFNRGLEFTSTKGRAELLKSYNFNAILWGKFEDCFDNNEVSNQLYYYAMKGDKAQAERILNNMDIESLTDHQKGFNCYYQAILTNSYEMLYKSIEYFNKCGEKFYRQLPILELKKQGEKEYILNALSA